MKVIILTAGIGKRIQSHTNLPKCLLKFSGKSLLERHFESLQSYSVSEVIVVTGYMEAEVRQELERIRPTVNVTTIYNEKFRDGSVVSLDVACKHVDSDEGIILMDADVIYDHNIIAKLINSIHRNVLLLDREFEEGDEPVKVCVKNNKIIEFRKTIADDIDYDLIGESVGFFKFTDNMINNLIRETSKYIDGNRINEPYEEVIRNLLLQFSGEFNYEDISGIPWMEIDFPEDVQKAEKEILPALSMQKDKHE